jgi:hypothetical protein
MGDVTDVLVYSAVFGGYDQVREPLEPGRYRLVTDGRAPWGWEEQNEPPTHTPRRRARYWKTAGMPTDAEFVVWLDGNIQLAVEPGVLVRKWLVETRADVALFRHPDRDCLFAEGRVCKGKGKDFPQVIDAQLESYRRKGFPARFGLGETPVLARRVCPEVEWFNDRWWREIENGSVRDQLSFDYVRWLMGDKIRVHFVDGGHRWKRREHEWLKCWAH